jgi:hypothetical protein
MRDATASTASPPRLRALVADGIQAGHMALHARAVRHAAGASGPQAEEVQQRLVAGGEVKLERPGSASRRWPGRRDRAIRPLSSDVFIEHCLKRART